MTHGDVSKGTALAAAVAALIAATACSSDGAKSTDAQTGQTAQLVCLGGNTCKGMSECAGGPGGSSCAGMNECKGQGWAYTKTAEECTQKGGKIKESDAA